MSYAKALELLRASGVDGLISGRYFSEGYCAIGAICPGIEGIEKDPDANGRRIGGEGTEKIVDALSVLGVTPDELLEIRGANDPFEGSRQDRLRHMLSWLEERAAIEARCAEEAAQ